MSSEPQTFRERAEAFFTVCAGSEDPAWSASDRIPRELLVQAAAEGFLGLRIPQAYGGAGVKDPQFGVLVVEQAMLAGLPSLALALALENDVVIPALLRDGSELQHGALLPRLADATIIGTVVFGDVAITDLPADTPGPPAQVALNGTAHGVVQGLDAELLIIVGHDGSERRTPRVALANSGKPGFTITASDPGTAPPAPGLADMSFADAPGQALGAVGGDPVVAERVQIDLKHALTVTGVVTAFANAGRAGWASVRPKLG